MLKTSKKSDKGMREMFIFATNSDEIFYTNDQLRSQRFKDEALPSGWSNFVADFSLASSDFLHFQISDK
jgi:hypothetical protein